MKYHYYFSIRNLSKFHLVVKWLEVGGSCTLTVLIYKTNGKDFEISIVQKD